VGRAGSQTTRMTGQRSGISETGNLLPEGLRDRSAAKLQNETSSFSF
jgi:hypothetical protein